MTQLARLASLVFNVPLLIAPDAALTVADVILAHEAGALPRTAFDDEESAPSAYRVENGIAHIPVHGELVNRGSWLSSASGLVSYEGLAADLRRAAEDPTVTGILLDMDSPGGQATGAMEAAALVRQVGQQKPVVAYVNGMAASAAYAIASGASRIVAMPSALLGSIGVVMVHMDRTGAMARAGVKPTIIYAGAHKVDHSSMQALPDDARARMQGEVDDIYGLFVETVVANRGLTEAAVRATEGGIRMGQKAVDEGLADEVGTQQTALAFLSRARYAPQFTGAFLMTDPVDQAAIQAQAIADATRAAATAERQRTQAILAAPEAQGRSDMAQHLAFQTDMSAEAAIALLKVAPAAAAAPAAQGTLAGRVPAPDIQPDQERREASGALPWDKVAARLNAEKSEMYPGFKAPAPRTH